jgi:hypothetical protein
MHRILQRFSGFAKILMFSGACSNLVGISFHFAQDRGPSRHQATLQFPQPFPAGSAIPYQRARQLAAQDFQRERTGFCP